MHVEGGAESGKVRGRAPACFHLPAQEEEKAHTTHASLVAASSGLRDVYMTSFGSVVQMNPGRIRRHMRRDRKSLFLSKPLTWAAMLLFPRLGACILGCACSCTRTPSHHILFHPFCAVPIPSLLCSAVESRDGAADVGRAVLAARSTRVSKRSACASIQNTRVSMRHSLGERISRLESAVIMTGWDVLGAVDGTPSAKLIALEDKAKPVSFKMHSCRVHKTR